MVTRILENPTVYSATSELTRYWTSAGAGMTLVAAAGRNGNSALRATTTLGSAWIRKTVPAHATYTVGAFITINALPSGTGTPQLFAFMDGATLHCDLRLNPAGTLSITRNGTVLGTTTYALSGGGSYYVEFKATIGDTTDTPAGAAEVRVNEDAKLTLTGVDTRNAGTAQVSTVQIGSTLGLAGNGTHDYCDLYANDGSGSTNTGYLGDVRIDALVPNGAGSSAQWTPSAGSNYQNVDDASADDDTTYNESSTAAQADLFTVGNVPTGATIKVVQHRYLARKTDAGSRTIKGQLKQGSTTYDGASNSVGDTYAYYADTYDKAPDTSAWTDTIVNALESGYSLVS